MANFARCPECGALNDGGSHHCYLCGASPLLVACSSCGTEVRNPAHNCCPSCGVHYTEGSSGRTRRRSTTDRPEQWDDR